MRSIVTDSIGATRGNSLAGGCF